MNDQLQIIEAVRERDIDLLILEELYAKTGFEKLFLEEIKYPNFSFSKAYRSVTTAGLGETDIQVEFTSGKKKLFLLIENKVDADFQDAQYERYMKRAELISSPDITTAVILVAPQGYIQNKSEFEYTLSYEKIRNWFAQTNDSRSWYKQELLRLAIDQERRGYQAVKDEIVTNFWKEYYLYITERMPDSGMPIPKVKPTSSSFVYFNPKWLPQNTRLIHKMEKGYLDLELSGRALEYDNLITQYNHLLNGMELVITGKSVCFRIEVTPISFEQDFNNQLNSIDQVITGIRAIQSFTMTVLK